VAIVGSGPAGFYAAQALLKSDLACRIDLFDRLPTPFGLVRHGVAPDHQKIKSVTAVYHKLASRPELRFFGNVAFGEDVSLELLRRHYHQIVFCTGAQTDRRLGIPGEDLRGSHPATEFVAWYNGHPDYSHLEFDLDCETAVVVGVGNVAVDVARVLCRSVDELAKTDIADYAIEALGASRVREVHLLGRRGPVQAAFTNPEVKELGELSETDAVTLREELELDDTSRAQVAGDRGIKQKLEILSGYVAGGRDKPRKLFLRFLVSPTEILGDADGRVSAVDLVRNELYAADDGSIRSRPTERTERLDTGLVFRSVGYRGVPLAGLPFREDWGIVPNDRGRILDSPGGTARTGLYVGGWIKRGPSGVIGTNKPDAAETVRCMVEDLRAGELLSPTEPESAAVDRALTAAGIDFVTYDDWLTIDAHEIARGRDLGRPRLKLTRHEEFRRLLRT
jgi:ferredoxin--NADP+ reductase